MVPRRFLPYPYVVEIVISESATIRPEPSARVIKAAALVKCQPRLPTHLAHPLKDNRAVVIHALGSSLQASRQNCSEPCRLLQADIPGSIDGKRPTTEKVGAGTTGIVTDVEALR